MRDFAEQPDGEGMKALQRITAILLLTSSFAAFASSGTATASGETEEIACTDADEIAQEAANLAQLDVGGDSEVYIQACECTQLDSGNWNCNVPWSVN